MKLKLGMRLRLLPKEEKNMEKSIDDLVEGVDFVYTERMKKVQKRLKLLYFNS